MAAASFRIRDARLPEDVPVIHEFILDLQRFEHALETNRRLDTPVAADYFTALETKVQETGGTFLIAEDDAGRAIGWAAAHEDEQDIYIVPEERRIGYIAELYVVPDARGLGVGSSLIKACEAWARQRSLPVIMIGVLSKNSRALAVYRNNEYDPYAIFLRKSLR
jgi:GNAT superfamily N-acetyltransferase